MRFIESMRAGRATLAVLLLAPFLIGGNHCLIGAFDPDARMRCAEVTPVAAPAPDHGCCQGGGTSNDDAPAPSPASCCITVGPVPADAGAPAPTPSDPMAVVLEDEVQEATSAVRARPVASFLEAPEPPPGAPHSSRAPPLS